MKKRTLKDLANFFECGVCLTKDIDVPGIDLLIDVSVDRLGGIDDSTTSMYFANLDGACEYLGLDKNSLDESTDRDLCYIGGTLTYPDEEKVVLLTNPSGVGHDCIKNEFLEARQPVKWVDMYNTEFAAFCIMKNSVDSSDRKSLKEYLGYDPPWFSCLTGHNMTHITIDNSHELGIPIIIENCNMLDIVVRKEGILIRGKVPDDVTCPECKGTGQLHPKWNPMYDSWDCGKCNGSGRIPKEEL